MAIPLVFPTGRFGYSTKDVDIERQTLKGGTALSGAQDVTSTDGGGRVYAEFADSAVIDRSTNLAWRALKTVLDEGVVPVVVPFCDIRHTPYGNAHEVPHSDGTPFSDGTLYSGGGPIGATVGAAILRATAMRISLTGGQPLQGGEWFSIEHPTKGWRAYRIATINGDTVTFRPPLREAVPAGQYVEFRAPRCLMVQDGTTSSRTQYGRQGDATIRFVEAP